ncbi:MULTISPECIES: HK97 family phage prohead protease [Agrobacterium]|uniref:HK97 family phage prohead protease n=1 Tax=Agrobacterium tumefaciens TaxID=358 RepID=A0AAE6EE82_AGRTU|nr:MULTISPECIES: HK97 family phage prohead protease [Agrobacterium]QCL72716.1 HK97 family phage prohead protease [Agrobacterium tumefaciens]QCL78291.1 HK97 family phage prohead protease [Agrobacterium tumefaciens]CUX15287.1 Phage prohead protease, HK97 family [Agrobacterium sp. NCPPB 925]
MERLFFETKIAATDTGEITGLAWPFGSADRVGDLIEPGSFKSATLPLPMLFGHDLNDPIGVWSSASEDSTGLQVKGNLLINDVARAREVHALVKSGAVRGLSVGFVTKKSVTRKGGGRTISALDLLEVSLVVVGMHPGARVTSAKSAIHAIAMAEAINRAAERLRG